MRPPQVGNVANELGPTIEGEVSLLASDVDIHPHTMQEDDNSPRIRGSGHTHRVMIAKEQILSTDLLDARDALDLIAVAGSKDTAGEASLSLDDTHHRHEGTTHQPMHTGPVPAPIASSWDHFFLVKRGIVRANEAVEYLNFYFLHLWHLFPVIPGWYSLSDRYDTLAAEEPVLTMSLITTASRYHPLSGLNGHARSERVHWRTWPWVQRAIQSSIWGSSGMRRPGSIAVLLLFIEWHPRAINSPEDMVSDYSELELFDTDGPEPTEANRRPESSSIPERLNIVAPAYRSNKMSWLVLAVTCADEQFINPPIRAELIAGY